jgi:hypothetical protein
MRGLNSTLLNAKEVLEGAERASVPDLRPMG